MVWKLYLSKAAESRIACAADAGLPRNNLPAHNTSQANITNVSGGKAGADGRICKFLASFSPNPSCFRVCSTFARMEKRIVLELRGEERGQCTSLDLSGCKTGGEWEVSKRFHGLVMYLVSFAHCIQRTYSVPNTMCFIALLPCLVQVLESLSRASPRSSASWRSWT